MTSRYFFCWPTPNPCPKGRGGGTAQKSFPSGVKGASPIECPEWIFIEQTGWGYASSRLITSYSIILCAEACKLLSKKCFSRFLLSSLASTSISGCSASTSTSSPSCILLCISLQNYYKNCKYANFYTFSCVYAFFFVILHAETLKFLRP